MDAQLSALQRDSFSYFEHEVNPANGLVKDKTSANWPASIAATGFALATLRLFLGSQQGSECDATGYQGFYYHFLEMETGRRAWNCELSTVDTAFLLAGMLTAAAYFDLPTANEQAIRTIAEELYCRANWRWAQNEGVTITHGWKPESGFLPYRWEGYDEAILLYVLALGSPSYPVE